MIRTYESSRSPSVSTMKPPRPAASGRWGTAPRPLADIPQEPGADRIDPHVAVDVRPEQPRDVARALDRAPLVEAGLRHAVQEHEADEVGVRPRRRACQVGVQAAHAAMSSRGSRRARRRSRGATRCSRACCTTPWPRTRRRRCTRPRCCRPRSGPRPRRRLRRGSGRPRPSRPRRDVVGDAEVVLRRGRWWFRPRGMECSSS